MLERYQSECCPYRTKVREKLSELGISYVAHNPRRPGNTDDRVTNELTYEKRRDGGADQIPYLVDTAREEALYGSDDISEYLDERYA